MALTRHIRAPTLCAVSLCVTASLLSSVADRPAFGQGEILQNIIGGIILKQQELAQKRRDEVIAYKRLQSALRDLEFYSGPIDGDYGPRTAAGLAAYRRSIGRPVSGPTSYEEIDEIESRVSEQIRPEPSAPSPPAEQPQPPATSFIRANTPPQLNAKLSDAAAWILIASRPTPEEAQQVAETHLHLFPSTIVIRASNDLFAVVIGWLNKEHGRPLKDMLISNGLIPPDSFLSSGEKFEPPVWSRDGGGIKSRADLLRYCLLRTTPSFFQQVSSAGDTGIGKFNDLVSGLSDPSDGLSLRTGASSSSKEIRQLPEGTPLQVLRSKNSWHQVKLLNGISGWVSAQYVSRTAQIGEAPSESDSEEVGKSPEEQSRQRRLIESAHSFLDDLVVYLKLHPDTPDICICCPGCL